MSLIKVVSTFKKVDSSNLALPFSFKKPLIELFPLEGRKADSNIKSPRSNNFLYWLSIRRFTFDVLIREKVKSELFPIVKNIGCLIPVPSKSELRKLGAKRPEARVTPGSGVCKNF